MRAALFGVAVDINCTQCHNTSALACTRRDATAQEKQSTGADYSLGLCGCGAGRAQKQRCSRRHIACFVSGHVCVRSPADQAATGRRALSSARLYSADTKALLRADMHCQPVSALNWWPSKHMRVPEPTIGVDVDLVMVDIETRGGEMSVPASLISACSLHSLALAAFAGHLVSGFVPGLRTPHIEAVYSKSAGSKEGQGL